MSDVKIRTIHEYDDIINEFKENKPINIYCEEIITPMSHYKKIVMEHQNYKLAYMLNRVEITKSKLELKDIINYTLDYMWDKMRKELHIC